MSPCTKSACGCSRTPSAPRCRPRRGLRTRRAPEVALEALSSHQVGGVVITANPFAMAARHRWSDAQRLAELMLSLAPKTAFATACPLGSPESLLLVQARKYLPGTGRLAARHQMTAMLPAIESGGHLAFLAALHGDLAAADRGDEISQALVMEMAYGLPGSPAAYSDSVVSVCMRNGRPRMLGALLDARFTPRVHDCVGDVLPGAHPDAWLAHLCRHMHEDSVRIENPFLIAANLARAGRDPVEIGELLAVILSRYPEHRFVEEAATFSPEAAALITQARMRMKIGTRSDEEPAGAVRAPTPPPRRSV